MYGVLIDSLGETKLTINRGKEFVLGRAEVENEGLVLEDEFVSRKHAVISFEKEFFLKDLESRNGSYINGELMKRGETRVLTDGDILRFGNCEYRFRISRPEKSESNYCGYSCSIKNSAGGRRFRIELKKRGCIDYQLNMIEENPQLGIAEIIYVKNIENDCFLCDIGGCMNLSDHIKQYRRNVDAKALIENILRLVKSGEEHLLERRRYLIHPETIFIDENHKLKLIYVPGTEEKIDGFSLEMRDLCRYLSKMETGIAKEGILRMGSLFENGNASTAEYIKQIYASEYSVPYEDKPEERSFKLTDPLNVKYGITLISFVVLMLMFWLGLLGAVPIFIMVASINIFMYGFSEGAKKGAMSVLKSKKFEK